MIRVFCGSVLSIAILVAAGCKQPTATGPAKAAVKGAVNLDGKPMADGEIRFSIPGQPVNTIAVQSGAYSGEAYPGKNKVEIFAYKAGPAPKNALSTDDPNPKVNYVADKYNVNSKLEAEVTEGGSNEFKFDVTSR